MLVVWKACIIVHIVSHCTIACFVARVTRGHFVALEGMALIDTGATRTCVEQTVLTGLGINPIGIVSVGTAAGPTEQTLFPAKLQFSEFAFTVDLGAVVAVNLAGQQVQGTALIALIGRDILSRCHFTYGGSGGFFSLSV